MPPSMSSPEDVTQRGDVILLVEGDVVARSADGGASWTTTTIPQSGSLLAVAFRDDDTAYATTKTGQIFRSDDAGQTWELDARPLSVGLGDIVFTSNGIGIAVGGIGGVLRMR
jgi:photosystem II stability/assembly factor-like uncharacterized protein